MEARPDPDPTMIRVDGSVIPGVTQVILEEGDLSLWDHRGWVVTFARGTWAKAQRVEPEQLSREFGGNPRNLP